MSANPACAWPPSTPIGTVSQPRRGPTPATPRSTGAGGPAAAYDGLPATCSEKRLCSAASCADRRSATVSICVSVRGRALRVCGPPFHACRVWVAPGCARKRQQYTLPQCVAGCNSPRPLSRAPWCPPAPIGPSAALPPRHCPCRIPRSIPHGPDPKAN